MLLSRLLLLADIEPRTQDFGSMYLRTVAACLDIGEIFCDSRKVTVRGLYIAMEGLHTDSHYCLSEAIEHGAVAAVVSKASLFDGRIDVESCKVPLVTVDDCREAFARIYAAWYVNPQKRMKFIGVTGTNGKTSVSRMIYEVLSRSGRKCGLIGTTGSYIASGELGVKPQSAFANMTTPDPPELYKALDMMANNDVEYVVMEVSSHALALKKVAPIEFEVGVFTNLTEDHLDFHHDMEDYFLSKALLFPKCRNSVINIDDKYGRRLVKIIPDGALSCSTEGRDADFYATDIHSSSQNGIEYKLSSSKMRVRIRSRIPGNVTVMNTMQATIACSLLGIPARDIKEHIFSFEGVPGRLERLKLSERVEFTVYIDYAHTPDALENLLRSARSFSRRGQRIVLLFGCGGDREIQKRSVMGRIASEMSDFFVLTSDNSRSERASDIIDDITRGINGGATYKIIEDRRDAIEYVVKNARRGDIILLAGKGHEEYEIDSKGKRPFVEREIVNELVKKYYS